MVRLIFGRQHNKFRESVWFIFGLFILVSSQLMAQMPQPSGLAGLHSGFVAPPLPAKPRALWPWVNGNVSLSAVTYELEEAKAKGMGGFDIWDVGTMINPNGVVPDGPAFLGDTSLQAIAHTVREAERLGLDIGLITSSSWNAGGSWVEPRHGAMGIFRTDTILTGPKKISLPLAFPVIPAKYSDGRNMLLYKDPKTGLPVYYREVSVLAHPIKADSLLPGLQSVQVLDARFQKGRLNWSVPPGTWRLVRYVCAPTGQPLMIPSPQSNGLLVDHFSAEAQEANMKYVIDRLSSALGSLQNRALKYLYEDSYEVNSAVWTPSLPEEFQKRKGYSLVPYLPVLDGFIVQDKEHTKRFLFDFKKVLSDMIIENHYRRSTEICRRVGLGFHAEAGGPGEPIHNVPFEDLRALGSLTVPRGEFWNKHNQLDQLQIVKGISSAAHIYNQRYVEAEAFTSVWLWQEGPSELKPLADRAMCEGLNRFLYHTFPHTPPESGKPGWVYNFGTLINTTNGWWPMSSGFHTYLGRCSFLLQQGEFRGDVAFYYGDKAPNFVPMKSVHAGLGLGFDYDVVNSEVILQKLSVKDSRIYLPHGQYYEVLVLPDDACMNPSVLNKIGELVRAGAWVIGARPQIACGLQGGAASDEALRTAADQLWGPCDGQTVKEHQVGQGRIFWGKSIREVLGEKGIGPDCQLRGAQAGDSIDFIHRQTEEADIYFIVNKGKGSLKASLACRVRDRIPILARPETGEWMMLDPISVDGQSTTIPLRMRGEESFFIVWVDASKLKEGQVQIPTSNGKHLSAKGSTEEVLIPLSQPWEIRFGPAEGRVRKDTVATLASWHQWPREDVRYFSGQASYRTQFVWAADRTASAHRIELELNQVREVAEVYLNGERLGYHWHPGQAFDISKKIRAGRNELVVDVVNSINNWLVGDARRPASFRTASGNVQKLPNAWMKPFAEAPLLEAGLLGPVQLRVTTWK